MTRRREQEQGPKVQPPPRPPSAGATVRWVAPSSQTAPDWAHAILTAFLTGEPLSFGSDHPPADIIARLDEARADGTLGAVPTMAAAVARDLDRIKTEEVPGGYTYAAIAVYLARVIDSRGKDDGPSVTAKLADQLGKAMSALTRRGGDDDDGFDEFSQSISEPVVSN